MVGPGGVGVAARSRPLSANVYPIRRSQDSSKGNRSGTTAGEEPSGINQTSCRVRSSREGWSCVRNYNNGQGFCQLWLRPHRTPPQKSGVKW